jgi:hypothetical protein
MSFRKYAQIIPDPRLLGKVEGWRNGLGAT